MQNTTITVADDVMTVTLNRPEVRNALDTDSWLDLIRTFTTVADRKVRAVVLTGAGGAFSAGGDLRSAHTNPGPGIYGMSRRLLLAQQAVLAIAECPLPVVAAVAGPAAGVGWSLALSCDIIVAAESAYFLAPFLDRGLIPDGGLVWWLARSVGRHRALAMMLTRQRISATEGQAAGFVHQVIAEGDPTARAQQIARDMAAGPTETIGLVKELLDSARSLDLRSYLRRERDIATINRTSGNPAEGVAAWREHRDTNFRSGYDN